MWHPQVLPTPCQHWQCQPIPAPAPAWIPLLQSQLKNGMGTRNMVLSMEEPWPGKGDLPWEYSRAPDLAAALGLPHRLGMSQRVLQPGHIGQPLRDCQTTAQSTTLSSWGSSSARKSCCDLCTHPIPQGPAKSSLVPRKGRRALDQTLHSQLPSPATFQLGQRQRDLYSIIHIYFTMK